MKILFALLLASGAFGQQTINGGRTILGPWDASASPSTLPFSTGIASALPATCTVGQVYFATDGVNGRQLLKCTSQDTWNPVGYDQGTATPATCGVGQLFFNTTATAGQNLYMCTATDTWTQQLNTGGSLNKAPGCTFDGGGSTITLNSICYARVRVACTLSTSFSILAVGSSPTATVNVFKVAAGTLLPTSTIISSSTPALATGNAVIGTTAWTSATVVADDILGFKVTAVSNATWLDVTLKCN